MLMIRTEAQKAARRTGKPNGRPSKYKPEYCQMLLDYMTQEPWEEVAITHTNRKGETWTEDKLRPNRIKFIQSFAWNICNVPHETLLDWVKVYPEFRQAYARARDLQSQHLLENGFMGLSDPAMTKFAAVNMTDMRDKQDITSDGRSIAPVVHLQLVSEGEHGKSPV